MTREFGCWLNHHHDDHDDRAAYSPFVRYLEATHVEQTKKAYDQIEIEGSAALELAKEPDCYTILASSIAPEIYGHLDVKKSLLLQVKSLRGRGVHEVRVSDARAQHDERCSWWADQIET